MQDHDSPSFSAVTPLLAATAVSVPAVGATPPLEHKKKDKVRSAWISFTGRIVAQLIGAMATVLLGLAVVTTHGARTREATTSVAPAAQSTGAQVQPATHAAARRAPGHALVVLPFQDYSSSAARTAVADGITEAVTAVLARSGRVQVTSRTSAMQYRQPTRSVPAIAAELGVDFVLEGSIIRQADRVQVTVQLIDATSDTHVWAETYEHRAGDLIALAGRVSSDVGRDLAGVLPQRLPDAAPSATASAQRQPITAATAF